MENHNNRPWGKAELAHAYIGAHMTDRSARQWLRDELERYPGLMDELCRLGYSPRAKRFTVAQVRAIFAAIGEP